MDSDLLLIAAIAGAGYLLYNQVSKDLGLSNIGKVTGAVGNIFDASKSVGTPNSTASLPGGGSKPSIGQILLSTQPLYTIPHAVGLF